MSESAYTPGPWIWIDYPDGRKLLAAPSQAVIHCPDSPMGIDAGDQRLIASAPELLAALVDVLDELEARWDMNRASTDPGIKHGIQQGRAAIAKALGR